MKFWAVIGRDRTRKSTTIYSLTGCTRPRPMWGMIIHGEEKTCYVDPRSAQERAERATPDLLINALNDARKDHPEISHAMLAFHPERRDRRNGIGYLEALKNENFECIGVLFTSPCPKTEQWVRQNFPQASIHHSPGEALPSQHIANTVREAWGLI